LGQLFLTVDERRCPGGQVAAPSLRAVDWADRRVVRKDGGLQTLEVRSRLEP
jgi:hypothetical protein